MRSEFLSLKDPYLSLFNYKICLWRCTKNPYSFIRCGDHVLILLIGLVLKEATTKLTFNV